MTERQQDWIGQKIYEQVTAGKTVRAWVVMPNWEKWRWIEAAKAVYPLCLAIHEAKRDQRAA